MILNSFPQALDFQWQMLTGNHELNFHLTTPVVAHSVEFEIGSVDANRKILSSEASVSPTWFSFPDPAAQRFGLHLRDAKVTINPNSGKFVLAFTVDIEGTGIHLAGVSYTVLVCTARI
jgi:hypothetical protein